MNHDTKILQLLARHGTVAGLMVLLSAAVAFGQFDTGQISGFVRDSAGLVVPGVTVTATNEGNRQQGLAVSNDAGYFVFPSLLVATYTITAELPGFKRFVVTGIRVTSAAKISMDAVLEVGQITDTVEVHASTAAVQSDSAVLGRSVGERELSELAISGRNPVFLSRLKAGVMGGRMSDFSGTSIGTGVTSISGGRANDVLVTVDGAIANRTRSTDNTMLGAQDAETVKEVEVLTSNYSAEYGRASSGIIRMVTKSGTQDFHGTLTEVFQNSALNANTWSRNASGNPRLSKAEPWRYNQFGFNLSGPIFIPGKFNTDRRKLFFFWGEEWLRRRSESTVTYTVPTLAMRNGDLSELLNPSNTFFGKSRVATDPTTGKPFLNNVIPPSQISPQGKALLAVYPLPTPGFQEGTANYIGTFASWANMKKDTFRIDYLLSSRHSMAFRATRIPYHFNIPDIRFSEGDSRPNRTAAFSLTSTFSRTFLNEFTLSANSDGYGEMELDPACGARCKRSTYGVSFPFLFPAAQKFEPEKLPIITVTGLSTIDTGPYPGYWSGFVYALNENMTKILRTHTFKWGILIERSGQNDAIQFTTAAAPATYNQNGAFRFLDTGTPVTTGMGIANALLGYFNDYSELGFKPMTPFVATAFDWFVQDSWKATPKLNVEAGVRYSLWPPWKSKWNTLAMFDPAFYDPAKAAVVDRKGGFIVSGDRYNGIVMPGSGPLDSAVSRFPFLKDFTRLYHNLPPGFAETHKGGFQPRFGLGYAVNRMTAIRAGAGLFLNRLAINRDIALGGNPPFTEQQTVINGIVDAPGGATPQNFPFTITMQDPILKTPRAWTWNVTMQRELPWNIALEAAYVGRRGYNNQRKRNINQLLPGTLQANPGINTNALRPYLGMGIIGFSENSGVSRYNGLQISIDRRMGTGLQFGLAYTYSVNKDNGSGETQLLPNSYDDKAFYGISDLDRTHVLLVTYMYNLPSPQSGWRPARYLLEGWAVSGINQFQSGSPFSVAYGTDYAGVGAGSGNQFWNQVGDPGIERTDFTKSAVWFNKAAFAAPAQGTFGVQPRNGLRNPGFWEMNMSVRRSFRVTEKQSFNLRWEAFNMLNHSNFGSAVSNPTSGSFGLVTSKSGNRTMQFVLQYRF